MRLFYLWYFNSVYIDGHTSNIGIITISGKNAIVLPP